MIKTRITEKFGIEAPIIMGGMTGVGYGELVASVANAGAFGFITAHMFPSGEALKEEIAKTPELTDKPCGVNPRFENHPPGGTQKSFGSLGCLIGGLCQ